MCLASRTGGFLDAAIVALSTATLFVTFVVVPVAGDGTQSALARVVGSACPMGDVVWVSLLARMLIGPGARTAAFWWLAVGTSSTLAADVAMNVRSLLDAGDFTPVWMNVLWQFFYVALAIAAWCESESEVEGVPAELRPREERGLTVVRLIVLALAATLPSAVLLGLDLTGHRTPTAWPALGSLLLIGLVVVRVYDLPQQVRSQSAQLAALGGADPLTGVANRRTWDHELTRTSARIARSGGSPVVALLDLDHFKAYNDTNGHQADHENQAVTRIDELRHLVGDGQTCSIGVSRWDGAEPAFDLFQRADQALYRAKAAGRDRLAVAPELGTDLTAWGSTFVA